MWQIENEGAYAAVSEALNVGYRHIDTASRYENEEGVGRALAASGLNRDEYFVTTKLANLEQGYDETFVAYEESLERLGLEYVDLYLIHWPHVRYDLYAESWQALVELQKQGKVGSIGVSNFHEAHLDRIIAESGVIPVLNQIELHAYFQQNELREVNARLGIATQAYSPLGQGGAELKDALITGIAERIGATTAQVILAWHLAVGNIVIPKSVTPSRIAENFAALDVALEQEDLDAIATLDRGDRIGTNPDVADFGTPHKLAKKQ